MSEFWKNVVGFEGYMVSNLGKIKSLKYNKERILKPGTNKGGYLQVNLCKNGKEKNYLVHRLVATAFIYNPDNLPQINHINEDKTDNRVDNLEWCDSEYNNNYGTRNERVRNSNINHPSKSKPVYSINKTTNEITYYQSATDAGRETGIYQGNICNCCNGKRKSAGGYKWFYA